MNINEVKFYSLGEDRFAIAEVFATEKELRKLLVSTSVGMDKMGENWESYCTLKEFTGKLAAFLTLMREE